MNQSVHPQKTKKKQSIESKAKDSKTVTKVHKMSSTKENSCHLKLQPPVKYDKFKSGHRKTDVGRVNSKASRRKADRRNHMAHMIGLRFLYRQGQGGRLCFLYWGSGTLVA
ncbi:hypothetical protein V6N13_022829 [Hibiscus sabdariffa]|uniref:Uncharacterized protein n=2 Tax=Hibiscus sabdariffa TaxID=183260 RepID=A0ABR2BCY1_9ROSI